MCTIVLIHTTNYKQPTTKLPNLHSMLRIPTYHAEFVFQRERMLLQIHSECISYVEDTCSTCCVDCSGWGSKIRTTRTPPEWRTQSCISTNYSRTDWTDASVINGLPQRNQRLDSYSPEDNILFCKIWIAALTTQLVMVKNSKVRSSTRKEYVRK